MKYRKSRYALALLLLIGIWAILIEPRWVLKREISHTVAQWQGPPGFKVAVASDWHFTKHALRRVMTIEHARNIIRDINAAKPDVILLPGDFIAEQNYRPEFTATPEGEIAAVLGELKAPYGVYAVLGNHEWWYDGEKFRNALHRQNIHVLENEATPLAGTPLWVAGIGDEWTGHSQPAQALSNVPAGAQILTFMHEPASLYSMPPIKGLIVAGHTHGGQVYLPFIGALVVPGNGPRAWAHGWITYGTNQMYITSGLGVSIFPIRFNMRPEWVLFTINAAQ